MNKTHVRAGRLADLHRQTLRTRGAIIAMDTVRACLEAGLRQAPSPLRWELENAATAAIGVARAKRDRFLRLRDRRDVGYDTRLARANGWGSAGDKCPAGHDAKTPAAREQVAALRRRFRDARRVAPAPARDTSASASAQPRRWGIP